MRSVVRSVVRSPVRSVVRADSAGAASTLLLDDYTAAHAYSLRKLRTAYSGSAIRVRRSNDNAEQDIGFSGNDLDESALTTFVGANNGFVVTWYDQAGSANLTNATAAQQPQVVSSGTVVTDGTRPAVSTSTHYLAASGAGLTQPNTYFAVFSGANTDGASTAYLVDGVTTRQILVQVNGEWTINAGSTFNPGVVNRDTFTQAIDAWVFDNASSQYWQNGSSVATGTVGTNALSGLAAIGRAPGGSTPWVGKVSELLLFDTDETSNVSAITTAINSYYSAF